MIVYQCAHIVWLEASISCCTCCILLCPGCLPSWLLLRYQINNTTDNFGSIWRLKRNPLKPWKALQTASKCLLTSSTESRKFESDWLCHTMREFPKIMEKVVNFIWRWLKSWKCACPFIFIWIDLWLMSLLQSSISLLTLKRRKQLNWRTNSIISRTGLRS